MTFISGMKIFDTRFYTALYEELDQRLDNFTKATRGAFVMASARTVGDREIASQFNRISGLVNRRDLSDDTTDISTQKITQKELVNIKIARRTDFIQWTANQFNWIQRNPNEARVKLAEMLAQEMFQDMINTSILSARAAIVQGAVGYTVPSNGAISHKALNEGARKFGDKYANIRCQVMHSDVFFDLLDQNLGNSDQLFEWGTVKVLSDHLGNPFVITDSPSLVSGSPSDYYTLGLADGAVTIRDEGTFTAEEDKILGKENLIYGYQAEWDFSEVIKGYNFNEAKNIQSPTDAQLATGANWTKHVVSDKNTAGVFVKSR